MRRTCTPLTLVNTQHRHAALLAHGERHWARIRPLFQLHPALSVVLALVLLQGLGVADPDAATAIGNLAFRLAMLAL